MTIPDYVTGFIMGAGCVSFWLAAVTKKEWRLIFFIEALLITILSIIIPFCKP